MVRVLDSNKALDEHMQEQQLLPLLLVLLLLVLPLLALHKLLFLQHFYERLNQHTKDPNLYSFHICFEVLFAINSKIHLVLHLG